MRINHVLSKLTFWLWFLTVVVVISQDQETCLNDNYMGFHGAGILASDNFPFDYRNALTDRRECRHRIYLDHDTNNIHRNICFTFHRFDLEYSEGCVNDYLEFPSNEANIRYCGNGTWSHGNEVTILANIFSPELCFPATISSFDIKFYADTRINGTGYYATFKVNENIQQSKKNQTDKHRYTTTSTHKPTTSVTTSPQVTTGNLIVDVDNSSIGENNHTINKRSLRDLYEEIQLDQSGVVGRQKRAAEFCDFDPTDCKQYCYHGHVEINGCKQCACMEGITAPCFPERYTCFNRKCINITDKCNGVDNCGDNSDEDYTHARCPGTQGIDACTFDDESTFMCQYVNIQGWARDITSPYGPRYDHTFGIYQTGHFLYTAAYKYENGRALLNYGNDIHKSTEHCYSFWYYMSGYVGTLQVKMVLSGVDEGREGEVLPPVWARQGNYNPRWLQGQINLPASVFPISEITFFYQEKINDVNNIALDDITLMEGSCWGGDHSCLFEIDMCGWQNDMDRGSVKWERHFGPTDSEDTGPDTDRKGNPIGYYLYMEATDNQYNDKAVLISRPVSNGYNGIYCLTFWTHMYGRSVNALRVYALESDNTTMVLLWSDFGDNRNRWRYIVKTIENIDGPFQILFEATVGQDFKSDIAIDDIIITREACTNNIEPSTTTTTSVAPKPPPTCRPGEFLCDHDRCIDDAYVCDKSFDCEDRTDEMNCGGALLDTGVIVGICVALLLTAVIIFFTIYFIQRKRKMMMNRTPRHPVVIDPSLYYDPTEDDIRIHGYSGDQPPPYNLIMDNPAYMGPSTQLPSYSSVPKKPPPYEPKVKAKVQPKHGMGRSPEGASNPVNASLVGYGAQGIVGNSLYSSPGNRIGGGSSSAGSSTLTISLVTPNYNNQYEELPPSYNISIIPTRNGYSPNRPDGDGHSQYDRSTNDRGHHRPQVPVHHPPETDMSDRQRYPDVSGSRTRSNRNEDITDPVYLNRNSSQYESVGMDTPPYSHSHTASASENDPSKNTDNEPWSNQRPDLQPQQKINRGKRRKSRRSNRSSQLDRGATSSNTGTLDENNKVPSTSNASLPSGRNHGSYHNEGRPDDRPNTGSTSHQGQAKVQDTRNTPPKYPSASNTAQAYSRNHDSYNDRSPGDRPANKSTSASNTDLAHSRNHDSYNDRSPGDRPANKSTSASNTDLAHSRNHDSYNDRSPSDRPATNSTTVPNRRGPSGLPGTGSTSQQLHGRVPVRSTNDYHNPLYEGTDSQESIPRCDSYRNINAFCVSGDSPSETTV